MRIGPESLTDADQWKTLKKAAKEAWTKGDLLIRISPKSASPPPVDVDTDELLSRLAALVVGLLEHKATNGIFFSGGDTAGKC